MLYFNAVNFHEVAHFRPPIPNRVKQKGGLLVHGGSLEVVGMGSGTDGWGYASYERMKT